MANDNTELTEAALGIGSSFELSDTEALDLLDGKVGADKKDIKPIDEVPKDTPKDTPKADKTTFGLDAFEDEPEIETTPKDAKPKTDVLEKPLEETSTDEDSPFATITKELVNLGIFTLDEGEELDIQDADTFAGRWEHEKKKGVVDMLDEILTAKGEDKKEWFDAIVLKGVDPKEYMKQQVVIDNISNLDLTKEANQERIVRAGLKDQGFEDDDVEAKLAKIKSYGDLEEESARVHKVLLKKETQNLENLRLSKEREAQSKLADDTQYKTVLTQLIQQKLKDKEYDGIPLSPKIANETFDFLYTKKYKLPNGELLTEFDKEIIELKSNPDLKLKLGLIINLLKTDPTLATVVKKGVSKQAASLFNDLASKKKETVKAKIATQEPKSWFQ